MWFKPKANPLRCSTPQNAGKKLLRRDCAVESFPWTQAVIAAVAGFVTVFLPEITKEGGAAAGACLRALHHLTQLRAGDQRFALAFLR